MEENDENIFFVKLKNQEECFARINCYNLFNEEITKGPLDISYYFKFLTEHASKDDFDYLLDQQENFLLIKLILSYLKYYTAGCYIYSNTVIDNRKNIDSI